MCECSTYIVVISTPSLTTEIYKTQISQESSRTVNRVKIDSTANLIFERVMISFHICRKFTVVRIGPGDLRVHLVAGRPIPRGDRSSGGRRREQCTRQTAAFLFIYIGQIEKFIFLKSNFVH